MCITIVFMQFGDTGNIQAYLRDIAKYPVLEHREQLKLFTVLNDGSSTTEEKQRAKQKLINTNLRLVISVARKYKNMGIPMSDLIQEGSMGLIVAIDKFDPARGTKLSTYATWWIRQAIIKHLTESSRSVRLPAHIVGMLPKLRKARAGYIEEHGTHPTPQWLAEKLGETEQTIAAALDASGGYVAWDTQQRTGETDTSSVERKLIKNGTWDAHESSPEHVMISHEMKDALRNSLKRLSPREEQIMRLRFGLMDDPDSPQWYMSDEEEANFNARVEGGVK